MTQPISPTPPTPPTLRTNSGAVTKILGAKNIRKLKQIDLEPAMYAANQVVTVIANLPINASAPQQTAYTAYQLYLIETWLSAHFVAMTEPSLRKASESIGGASQSLMAQAGMNLSMTSYGQQCLILDINGSLAWLDKHISQGKRSSPSISYLGTNYGNYYGYGGYPWRFFGLYSG